MKDKDSKSCDTYIRWGDNETAPISDYQKIYDGLDKMNEKEINHVSKKNPVWRSMTIVNNAMEDTNTSYVSPIKPPVHELFKQHTVHLAKEKLRKAKKSMS